VNISNAFLRLAILGLIGLVVAGCVNFQQVTDLTRSYVLSAMPAGKPATAGSNSDLAVGLGRVDVPAYLLDTRIAVRQGSSEIEYSDYHRWAERLDKGIQRVLGVNLASLLSSDRVVLSAWQRSEVKAEVYLAVQRFECNAQGQVILEARWRITSPGGEKTLRTDHAQITRQGPVFRTDADGAVGELSKALADLSQQIATSVQSISASPKVSQP